jgi:hypothetical protein
MDEVFGYDELEIIGYTDCRAPDLVPSIVPATYRHKATGMLIFAPFKFPDKKHISGYLGNFMEFHSMVADYRATWINQPLEAKPNHLLFLDDSMEPNYLPKRKAINWLEDFAKKNMEFAQIEANKGNIKAALYLLDQALCASSPSYEDHAVFDDVIRMKIVIHKDLGDDEAVKFLEEALDRSEAKKT